MKYDLTDREQDVVKVLVLGKSIKEIAAILKLSPRTIEHYINNIKLKCNCKKQSELIAKLLK